MSRKLIFAVIVALVSISISAEEYEAARAALRTLVPNLEIDSVRAAPFEGFVEVLLGAQLIYVSIDGKYVIDGQLIEVATRKNLSETSKGLVRKARLEGIGASERLVFPATSERKHRVTVFTDIDCGYCRRLHQQMAEYNELGIEVSYLFFPRAGLDSHSFAKAVSVWCAADKNEALTLAKAGEEPTAKQCSNPVEMHFNVGRELGVTGTPALIADDGTLIPGYVPPESLLGQLNALTSE